MPHRGRVIAAPGAHLASQAGAHEPCGDSRARVIGELLVSQAGRTIQVARRDQQLAAGLDDPW